MIYLQNNLLHLGSLGTLVWKIKTKIGSQYGNLKKISKCNECEQVKKNGSNSRFAIMLSQVTFNNSIEFNQTSQKVASNINIQFNTSPNFRKDYIWMVFWEYFWEQFFGKMFWRNFLEGILWEEFFVYIGIDLFVKILSKRRRKEKKIEVRMQAYRTWKGRKLLDLN